MSNKPNMRAAAPNQAVNLDITRCDELICVCGGYFFTPVYSFRIVPALLTGQPRDSAVKIEWWKCEKCGEIFNWDQMTRRKPELLDNEYVREAR